MTTLTGLDARTVSRRWASSRSQVKTASGSMVCSLMQHPARDIGSVGMVHQRFNSVPFPCSTMMSFILVTGLIMFLTVKNTVRILNSFRERNTEKNSTHIIQISFSFLSDVSVSLSFCVAICKDTPNGAVHIDKSCGRYWLCVGGYPRLQRCPAGLAFNPVNQRCELAQTVPGW